MHLVRLEPGTLAMGQDSGGDWDERPLHGVRISRPFYLGATEVTNAQYEQFDPTHRELRGKLGFSKEDDEAVVFVSWHEAAAFCEWLAKKEGLPYRLPTEAEWEYACRAGTTTPYHTGDSLPEAFHKNVKESWFPAEGRSSEQEVVPLTVGKTPPNAWGLFDMHGNVEEWCYDWYGPYEAGDQIDPVGREDGDFRATRGGSHSTKLEYLRSANRAGALPEDRSWLIGFRVVLGELPTTKPLPVPPPPLNRQNVSQQTPPDLTKAPDPDTPYFKGPRVYVKVPPGSEGPLFSRHNHDPALVECPNGDLLAIWYTCRTEPGRELGIAASRLRYGAEEWDEASPFWDTPDRNDHAPALWADEQGTLYHFNGLSAAATWGNLATVLRTSTDSGATWSKARLINPEHGTRHMPVESVFRCQDGAILLPCDAVTGGTGGTAIHLSYDNGKTWTDPGGTIKGIHAPVVQLKDGRLMSLGRGDQIDGRMPKSVSADMGKTWQYSASPFPPLGGGQRAVMIRLAEGPILFCSFAKEIAFAGNTGAERSGSGLFAALSHDEGETWQVKRLITDDVEQPRKRDGGGNTREFVMARDSAEPRGYMSIHQAANGVIHLISSKLHYAFNLKWLETPPPPPPPPPTAQDLPTRSALATVCRFSDLPTKSNAPWRFTGSGMEEAQAVSFPAPGVMKIATGANQRCRWADDFPDRDGFARVDASKGYTAEIKLQVLRSTAKDRGIDFETCTGDGTATGSRCFVTITRTGVYWSGEAGVEALTEDLDNHSAMHTYRLAVREDGIVQVYRDGELLGFRRVPNGVDPLFKPRGSYLQWGEGAGASEAEALVAQVAYDLAGAYQPPGDPRTR
jgi:hypothetical protein